MLAKAIPAQAASFMSYLIVKTSLGLTMELFRVGPIVVGVLFSVLAPKSTPRDRAAKWCGLASASEPGVLPYSQNFPDYFLAILLTLTFCPMSPVLCYFAYGFFVVSDVVFRRQLLFVYNPALNSTGLCWHPMYNFVIASLVVAQLTLLGVLSLKKAPGPVVAAAVLPFLTLFAHVNILNLYPRTATYLPLLDCVHIDRHRRYGHHITDFPKDNYVQPAMLARTPLQPEYPPSHASGINGSDGDLNIAVAPATALRDERDTDELGMYFLSD
ncbi:hypothetical protein DYB28_014139 [Aphanomyces astaci]|nr:hypothetical protein DYB26_015697 [Aphanomyces astaci]RLO00264.1 hypothetical protein DYB28_014139 [Aphanomyces astaci]